MTALITRKDYEALPEGAPYELHDGMLVKQPSPRFGHQRVQVRILERLLALFGSEGRVVAGPVDVLVDEITVFAPDIVVLSEVPPDSAPYVGTPLAVFEVLSPSTAARDRDYKTRRLLGFGVAEVWLVDPAARTIERVTIDGAWPCPGDGSLGSEVLAGFELDTRTLF